MPSPLDEHFGPIDEEERAAQPTGTPHRLNDPGTVQIAEHLAAGMGQHLPSGGKVRDGFLYAAREIRRGTSGHSAEVPGLCSIIDDWFATNNFARTLDHPHGAIQPVARRWSQARHAARQLAADPVAAYQAAQQELDERNAARYSGGRYAHLVQR